MDYLWLLPVFCAGAVIGSFLNVVICRLPAGQSLLCPPSHCPVCLSPLRFYDLVPILSYLFLKGKCRYCAVSISWQYPAVELLTGFLFVLAVIKYGLTWSALRAMVLFALAVPAAVIDWRHKIIPDKLNLTGFVLALPLLFESREILLSGTWGFLAGGGLLWGVALLSRGGMGGGDIKLAAVLGLLLGWKLLLVALFLAFAVGSIVGAAMLLLKKVRLKEAIPFGPYLALGAVCAALSGDRIVMWYGGLW